MQGNIGVHTQVSHQQSQPLAKWGHSGHEPNIWRDTALRYIGYADEAGEALEPFIGAKAVDVTYGVSIAYAMADTFNTSRKAYQNAAHKSPESRRKDTLAEIGDGLLFHVPATIFVPAFFVGRIREISHYIASKGAPRFDHDGKAIEWTKLIKYLKKPLDKAVQLAHANPKHSAMLIKKAPLIGALVGIASIPLVGEPTDKAIDKILDYTYRPWVGKKEGKELQQPTVPNYPQPPSIITPPDTFQVMFK